jgi:hypothetical protein
MSTTASDIFQEALTSGYKQEVGSWGMHIGVPDDRAAASLNTLTYDMVQAFLTAFRSLCTVVEMRYDTIAFNAHGQVEKVDEGRQRAIDKGNPEDILGELRAILPDNRNSFFTALFLYCDVQVFVPFVASTRHTLPPRAPGVQPPTVRIPRAVVFYLGFVLEHDAAGLLTPVDGSMSVDTSIDVWVPKTRDLAEGQWQDNTAYARYNRPRLDHALRDWEKLVGKPIVECHSRYYRDQIARYGFTAG